MSGGIGLVTRNAPCAVLAGNLLVHGQRTVTVCHPQDRAVVLGSMQQFDDAQVARALSEGYGVTRRMSGGGGVVIEPDEIVWIDCFVPVDDPSYLRDVREGAYVIGEWWVRALVALGCDQDQLEVHRGAMTTTAYSKMSCFAGLGPGEVTLAGRKIMGLSQRRTRLGAWYFTLVYLKSNPSRDARLLASDQAHELELCQVLSESVATPDVSRQLLTETFLSVLANL